MSVSGHSNITDNDEAGRVAYKGSGSIMVVTDSAFGDRLSIVSLVRRPKAEIPQKGFLHPAGGRHLQLRRIIEHYKRF